ncbi:MAG: hypothetical protein ABIT96_03620 [Ferruginibacter sp.]
MKNFTTNQEVLLLPTCSQFRKDWCVKQETPDSKKLSEKEQLIQLCWNGMLPEILPEVTESSSEGNQLRIWEINETRNMLDIRMGELDESMNDEWSINPYVHHSLVNLN